MKILIVEDDKNFGLVLQRELQEVTPDVNLTANGVDAVLEFIERRHDFVLLDINMPKLNGINALRIIKKLDPDVPAIAYSGNAGSSETAESVEAGAMRCLTKPFGIQHLKEDIRNCLLQQQGRVRHRMNAKKP